MIKINLARQLQEMDHLTGPPRAATYVIGVLLLLSLGIGSWWWTDSLRQQLETIRSDKYRITQNLLNLESQLKEREGRKAENEHLLKVLEEYRGHEDKKWPVALLNGISRGVHDLGIWLERVEMRQDEVKVQGKSLRIADIGKFFDALEDEDRVKSLPSVEIMDPSTGRGKVYSFRIQFPIEPVEAI